MLKVKEVRMNYERHLMGIDEMPRFTWVTEIRCRRHTEYKCLRMQHLKA